MKPTRRINSPADHHAGFRSARRAVMALICMHIIVASWVFVGCSTDGNTSLLQDITNADTTNDFGLSDVDTVEADSEVASSPDILVDTDDNLVDIKSETDLGNSSDIGDEYPPAINRTFPEEFLFGSAVAGFQVDMGCPTLSSAQCDDTQSDWYQFSTDPETIAKPGNYLSGQDPAKVGPGHWELYENDYDLAKDVLHNNAHRFSVEWSRIFPTATDGTNGYDALKAIANQDAIDHYHKQLQSLRSRGLEPLVTLNHYTLPIWIHDAVGCNNNIKTCSPKGWVDKDRTVNEIAKFAGFVAKEFGAEIDLWATLNEPFAIVLPGYIYPQPDRTNPPSVALALEEARTVLLALIYAHARMYDAIHENDTIDANGDNVGASVGVVYAMAPVRPKNPQNQLDIEAAKNVFYLWNMVFLNAVALGQLDDNLDGVSEPVADLANRMDYIGINYYTRITVEGTETSALPALSPLATFNPFTLEPWEDYPRGIYEMIQIVDQDLKLPTIVTENGSDTKESSRGAGDGETVAASYLTRHLAWVHQALAEGADVRGYFYWTLLDNFEWNHGMDIRMGLFAVDPDNPTKTRVMREAASVFGEIAKNKLISVQQQQKFRKDQ